MPTETHQAIDWALQQLIEMEGEVIQVTVNTRHLLVDKVREYFNNHEIEYGDFGYKDLEPFLS